MVRIATRTYFSGHHIQAAAFFAREARRLEVAAAGTRPVFSPDHRGYVVGAILSSAAFLEAAINELFTDAYESHQPRLQGLPANTITLFSRMWEHGIPRTARYSTLEKYGVALSLAEKPPMKKGIPPWQPTSILIKLRNALVHYEPEWMVADASNEPSEPQLAKLLRGLFSPNPLTGAGNPFYPDKTLGHGCAAWAVDTALSFAEDFFPRLGLNPPHDRVRTNLSTQ
jgi:hypothetical protein